VTSFTVQPLYPQGKDPAVATGWETGWAPEHKEKNIFVPARNGTQVVALRYTECLISAAEENLSSGIHLIAAAMNKGRGTTMCSEGS
jgi:20S proteasome alpha/beta subunit